MTNKRKFLGTVGVATAAMMLPVLAEATEADAPSDAQVIEFVVPAGWTKVPVLTKPYSATCVMSKWRFADGIPSGLHVQGRLGLNRRDAQHAVFELSRPLAHDVTVSARLSPAD